MTSVLPGTLAKTGAPTAGLLLLATVLLLAGMLTLRARALLDPR